MKHVKVLHHNLFKHIENRQTKESLSIICQLMHLESHHREKGESLLNRYSHTAGSLTPLIHSIIQENATVALDLLEKGCSPNIGIKHHSNVPTALLSYNYLFNVIGKPAFKPVVMKILEATNAVIVDKNANTVLHLICRNKLTSWLRVILDMPSQNYLFFQTNNQGYLPMHIAAEFNFLDYFGLVFSQQTLTSECCGEKGHNPVSEKEIHEGNLSDEINIDAKIEACDSVHQTSSDKTNRKSVCESIGKERSKKYETDKSKEHTKWKEKSRIYHFKSAMSYLNKAKVDINIPVVGKGISALHIAARHKYSELVKVLLEMGANVNRLNSKKHSPLFVCLNSPNNFEDGRSDLIEVCRYLIVSGADVNGYYRLYQCIGSTKEYEYNVTPLHLAAAIGCVDVVNLLLNNGADPTAMSKTFDKIPVQFALEENQAQCARVLLDQRLYPEEFFTSFRDKSWNCLLHNAGNCDERMISELVVSLKSNLDLPNLNGVFPLDKAIFFGNIPYIHAILAHRPDVVNVSKHYKTCPPLHRAACSALTHLPLCQILLSYGADIYARAYGKHNMAYRRALRSDCYENAVYLCEQMSRSFTCPEREELLDYVENKMDKKLALRLKCRLENIPSLLSHCLDVVRQVLITNFLSLKYVDCLPIPNKMMRALTYEDVVQL